MSQPIPKVVKTYVLFRDDWRCRHCNRGEWLDPHHVILRSQGVSHSPSNLLTLCRKCHDDIHGGRLKVEVIKVLAFNLVVKFWKQEGWKP